MVKLSNKFKSGKYVGQSYIEVWSKDLNYMYWMASTFPFFEEVVKNLEKRDKSIGKQNKIDEQTYSVEYVRDFFKERPICGFDMSEHISGIYERCPKHERTNYFNSLLKRNNFV